jgi:short-subunit dehydrogenase
LANELRSQHGVRVEVIGLDLEQVGAATQLGLRSLDALGLSVDMLINNAGFGLNDNFGDMAA